MHKALSQQFASEVLYDIVHYIHALASFHPVRLAIMPGFPPLFVLVPGCDRSENQANRSVLLRPFFIIAHAVTAGSGPVKGNKTLIKSSSTHSPERPTSKFQLLRRCSLGDVMYG